MNETIGPYQVEKEAGRGGMGVVYRARDSRLDRLVAIKSLPEEFASDPVRLERFEREARTLAQVTHPNIAGIYGIEEQGGSQYLVLEFVEGETLAELLRRGPLPVQDAIEIAAQIADGVAAAHDAGVIHRDLKPGNVIITAGGQAKVLDFGLARADSVVNPSTGEMTQTPTATYGNSPTIPGAILGTAPYMSPEQARGKPVDKRTDVWSFGVMLYEMLTGIGPFHGETATESIGAILHKEIDLGTLPAGTPARVRRVLERCIQRNKNERYRDIGDVRLELLGRNEPTDFVGEPTAVSKGIPAWIMIACAAVLAGAAGLTGWVLSGGGTSNAERVVRKLDLVTAETFEQLSDSVPKIAPSGDRVAFIRDNSIHIRALSEFESRPIAGTDGAEILCWSPDGTWIAFSTNDGIFKTPSSGGGVTKIADLEAEYSFDWTSDERVIVSNGSVDKNQIVEIPTRGGTPRVLLEGDEGVIDFHSMTSIPGSDVVLFVRHRSDGTTPIEAWDGERIVTVVDMDDTFLSTFAWSPTGHVIFTRGFGDSELWAMPFSYASMEVNGDPFLVMSNADSPSVSYNGTLSVLRGVSQVGGELIWISTDGSVEVIGNGGEVAINPLVSPDGKRIAFASTSNPPEFDLWVRDIERGVNSRVADLNTFIIPTSWSPDGSTIAAATYNPSKRVDGQRTVFYAADGTGQTREPHIGLIPAINSDWTTAVSISDPQQREVTVSAISLDDFSVINEMFQVRGIWMSSKLSPDETLMLHSAREGDVLQIYCTRFPSGEGRWQVSTNGGRKACWSPDGSAVYYSTGESLYRVQVTKEPELRFGVPERLFDFDTLGANFNITLDLVPDQNRFVAVRSRQSDGDQKPQTISIIENWYEEFRPRQD